ncbi:ATP-binding cassette domain-containing protein, partial [Burkholderia sp. Cy-637]|uniref:ATP-binding cassette domain-containing protein n=1 Tax=Burkholderia sp. Cy-637 TaxID=2608327 RepID=UPI001965B2E3
MSAVPPVLEARGLLKRFGATRALDGVDLVLGAGEVVALMGANGAGKSTVLMNLSGAHGPFFTRNVVILRDSSGHTGVGEVPGGEAIRKTI